MNSDRGRKPVDAPHSRAESVQARRNLIVDGALACFIEQGFHQTSMRDIAARAGVSLGNLYNHFDSKAALIAEIVTLEGRELAAIEDRIAAIADPRQALDRFVDLYLRHCCQPEGMALYAEITAEALRNREVRIGLADNRPGLIATVSALVATAARHGDAGPAVKPAAAAPFIIDLIEGLAMRSAFEDRQPRRAEKAALRAVIRRIAGL